MNHFFLILTAIALTTVTSPAIAAEVVGDHATLPYTSKLKIERQKAREAENRNRIRENQAQVEEEASRRRLGTTARGSRMDRASKPQVQSPGVPNMSDFGH
jgi:hypothetical protein